MAVSARGYERTNAKLPLKISGRSAGTTRDISPSGIYFETKLALKSGSVIRFTLEFHEPHGALSLDCTGEIVRVEKVEGKVGVATRIIESRLQRSNGVSHQGLVQGANK